MDNSFTISLQLKAFIFVFVLTIISGFLFIPLLRKFKLGQTVRYDGPATHLKKTGTPAMGGIIFLIPVLISGVVYSREYPKLLIVIVMTLLFGLVGFIDDFSKVIKKSKDGLSARHKMFWLIVIAVIFTFYAVNRLDLNGTIIVPLTGMESYIKIPYLIFIPFTVFVIISTTNAVNLTDGLDGLAAGTTLIIMVFFTIIAIFQSEWDYIRVFSAIIAGGCMAFLVFNFHPAKAFMGDTGALALGGAVSAAAILMDMPWIILIAGAIYVVEVLSVMVQVISFKTRGKRVLKMAPIHHHLELCGWRETRIVLMFWSVTAVLCIIGFLSLKIKL